MIPEPPSIQTSPKPQVAFDWRDWLPHLNDSGIPEADQQAFIEALWSIVIAFVDLGFEVKSTDEICGEAFDLKAALAEVVVSSAEDEEAA